jgi:hypothetical protein
MLLRIGEIVAGLALLTLLGALALGVRRRIIQRTGSFDCSLRVNRKTFGRGWALGVARYAGDRLEWFRVFSLSIRPREVLPRDGFVIVRRRDPEYPENLALMAGHVVLECRESDDAEVDLAMSPEAATGLVAWLEARPPGQILA